MATMQISPETHPIIWGYGPGASDAIVDTSDWVCLRGAAGVMVNVFEIGNNATNLVLTVHEGTTNSGTTAITTGAEFPIWINTNCSTSDTMVRQTNGLTYTIVASAVAKLIQFYIPADILSDGYDWIQLGTSGGHATNIACVFYQLDGVRFQQATPLTAIV